MTGAGGASAHRSTRRRQQGARCKSTAPSGHLTRGPVVRRLLVVVVLVAMLGLFVPTVGARLGRPAAAGGGAESAMIGPATDSADRRAQRLRRHSSSADAGTYLPGAGTDKGTSANERGGRELLEGAGALSTLVTNNAVAVVERWGHLGLL